MPELTGVVLRTIAVSSALLLALLLLGRYRKSAPAVPGAMLALAIAAFFVTSANNSGGLLGLWSYPLTALCVTKAIWFWLFSRALFRDDARLTKLHVLAAVMVAAAGTWQQKVFLPGFRSGTMTLYESFAGLGFDALLFAFVLAGLNEAWRDHTTDLVERRRRLRLGFIVLTGTYLVGTLAVQTSNLVSGSSTPVIATWANMIFAAAACLAAASLLMQQRVESWIDAPAGDSRVTLNLAETAVLKQLQRALENEKFYLQSNLTIGALAGHLGTGEHVLRRVINQGMGHRNFNDFLHTWRIREACDELTRADLARQPVLSIAMRVGYGSIGAFNRAFKQHVGMTPTAFRRRALSRP